MTGINQGWAMSVLSNPQQQPSVFSSLPLGSESFLQLILITDTAVQLYTVSWGSQCATDHVSQEDDSGWMHVRAFLHLHQHLTLSYECPANLHHSGHWLFCWWDQWWMKISLPNSQDNTSSSSGLGLIMSPQRILVPSPQPVKVNLFNSRIFTDDQGWTLSQNDWCPYKKWKFGTRNRHAHRKNTMWTRQRLGWCIYKRCIRGSVFFSSLT